MDLEAQPKSLPSYITRLNPPQQEAATTVDGPLLVLAGAGSGKTRMLTSRIAYLVLECGVKPWEILAVTFTNKAAHEMRDRIASIFSENGAAYAQVPYDIGTFHAICAKILRREAAVLPFTKPFVIYDDSDQLTLLKGIVKRLGIDEKIYSPKSFQYAINRAKCDAEEPMESALGARGIQRKLPEVYVEYQRALVENNALDFGEMITLTYRLLRDHAEIRAKIQNRYKYVLVDEYQDTNRAQYLLLSQIAGVDYGGLGNMCVVGDEDQSIYGWRGADIRNILDFERDFPGAKIVKLEQNYRSTQIIVTASSQLISHNTERKKKTLWTESEEGAPIVRLQCASDRNEAEIVIKEIRRLTQQEPDLDLSDFAIFYRTHAQSRLFEEQLRMAKLPYVIVGGLRFFDRKEIKDIMAYFRLIMNSTDSVSFKRIINTPARGIGKSTMDKLESAWNQKGSLWDCLVDETISARIFAGRTLTKLRDFRKMIEEWITHHAQMPLSSLYHDILAKTKYIDELKAEGTDEAEERIANLEELDSMIAEFEERGLPPTLEGEIPRTALEVFLEQTALNESPETDGMSSSVQMMTFHACKGLEFPVVFMVGMEEGLFPNSDPEGLEEERRLCYVGMTRARERLYLSHSQFRRVWGDLLYQYPARFFDEISADFFEVRDFSKDATQKLVWRG